MPGDTLEGRQLRRAGPDDAPAIADLYLASRRAALPWLPELHGPEATAGFLRDVVLARAEVWLEASAEGALLGFIAFGGGEIQHLYVAPECQRQGIGARLMQLALQRGEPLELWVFARNEPARAFYQRHGFRTLYETDGADNEEREPDVRLRWEPPDR